MLVLSRGRWRRRSHRVAGGRRDDPADSADGTRRPPRSGAITSHVRLWIWKVIDVGWGRHGHCHERKKNLLVHKVDYILTTP